MAINLYCVEYHFILAEAALQNGLSYGWLSACWALRRFFLAASLDHAAEESWLENTGSH